MDIWNNIYKALIARDNYKLILSGLQNTLIMALAATLIGIVIGVIIAVIKYFAQDNKKLWIFDKICNIYTTVIRGTPVMVQLIILSGALLMIKETLIIAIIGFGINSGAYVAEIIRSGIFSIDKGQTEAGRSLGLTKIQTMRYIVLPQAIKNILPALGNEFIALLKETSIAGYVAVHDLTKAGELIKNNTFNSTGLYIVALIYLIMVMGMTKLLSIFERRLAKGDKR